MSLHLFRRNAAPAPALEHARAPLLLAVSLLTAACQTVPSFPVADLHEAGWTVQEGQAVWRPHAGDPEIAGDIVLATRTDGRVFAQFSKGAFPLLVAQSTPAQWEVQVPAENKHYSGRGRPPARLILLYLPAALAGQKLPTAWSWQTLDNGGWRLDNRATGQRLEGYLAPSSPGG